MPLNKETNQPLILFRINKYTPNVLKQRHQDLMISSVALRFQNGYYRVLFITKFYIILNCYENIKGWGEMMTLYLPLMTLLQIECKHCNTDGRSV